MRCAFSLVRQSTRSSKHYDRTRRPWQGPDIDKPGFPQERLAPFKSHQTTTSECRSQPEKVAFNGPLPGFAIANRSHPPGVTLVRIFAGSRNCLDRDEGTGEPRRDRRRLSARSPLPSVSRSRMRSVRPARRTFSRAGARDQYRPRSATAIAIDRPATPRQPPRTTHLEILSLARAAAHSCAFNASAKPAET